MKYFYLLLLLTFAPLHTQAFSDVQPFHPHYHAISWAQETGLVQGYSDGTFRPDATINRAEFAKILIGSTFTSQALELCADFGFTDTDSAAWYAKYLCLAAQHKIIGGYPDGSYRPANPINYVEAAKMIVIIDHFYINGVRYDNVMVNGKLVGEPLPATTGEWYEPYTNYLTQKSAVPSSIKTPGKEITRSEMVYILYKLQPKPMTQASISTKATVTTSLGTIELELYPESAPKTVENFTTHAKNGYYNDMIFHRVIPDFMIQGGDPTGTGMGGESIWGGTFIDEFDESLSMEYGTLAMANAGPGTNGSQFFIVQAKEGTPWLKGKHTIFGKVTKGMDVVDSIANADRDGSDKPLEDITFSISTE